MTNDQDHYEAYYGNKLWNLLPAIYRALDTDQFDSNGPLRELVNRIGAQAATLRRSLDRMWEDQSIETCDDWVIPYIGDLLATNLVTNLDARAQRLDVAKTIYYRRRKGTLAILEEIADDITGWDAKVVEFFRRLGRTRHGLDPAIGLASAADPDLAALRRAEGLVGPLTGTGIGGLADLRNAYAASSAGTAFDEFSHTADFRPGQGQVGWYGIPRLGVFLWRLQSFAVPMSTPVESSRCPGQYTFDPTGRQVSLFAIPSRNYGDTWTSPDEWQLPARISPSLLEPALGQSPAYPLYAAPAPNGQSVTPNALGVYRASGSGYALIPAADLTADPASLEAPTSSGPAASTPPPVFLIDPTHGRLFPGRSAPRTGVRVTYAYGFSSTIGAGPYDRRPGRAAPPTPDPQRNRSGGGALTGSAVIPRSGTLTLDDSLTYTAIDDVTIQGALTFRADNELRPVIRPAPTPGGWTEIRFHGSAGSCLVLDGLFFSGADLVLTGAFDCVILTCCTLDPGTTAPPNAWPPGSLFDKALDDRDLVPCRLWIEAHVGTLTVERSITGPIRTRGGGQAATLTVTDSIVQAIPTVEAIPASAPFSASYSASIPPGPADPALAFTDGDVILSRCTIMGPVMAHRLQASECILRDEAQVDDTQHGCVRFSAWAEGSRLPRLYESVTIAPGASLFTSADFGQPGYGQLLPTVDAAILPAAGAATPAMPTIAAGAQDGSEMGAFAARRQPHQGQGPADQVPGVPAGRVGPGPDRRHLRARSRPPRPCRGPIHAERPDSNLRRPPPALRGGRHAARTRHPRPRFQRAPGDPRRAGRGRGARRDRPLRHARRRVRHQPAGAERLDRLLREPPGAPSVGLPDRPRDDVRRRPSRRAAAPRPDSALVELFPPAGLDRSRPPGRLQWRLAIRPLA